MSEAMILSLCVFSILSI